VPAVGAELLLLLALLFINGLLAMSELAVVSARKVRLQHRAEAGDRGAAVALALANEPSRFLSTIQIGITAVGILAGAFGGATLTRELEAFFGTSSALAPHKEPLSFGLVVGITYLSLIIGELVPKQVALSNPERTAAIIARPMQVLSRLAAPLVWLLSLSSDALLRILRIRPASEETISEDEIKLLIQQGTHSGAFAPVEQELIEGALDLGDQRVNELMTPRPHVVWLDVQDEPEENWQKVAGSPHTLFPVCEGNLDSVRGIVSVKDLWTTLRAGRTPDLEAMRLAPPSYALEHQPALQLLDAFASADVGLVLVIDEHGSIQGVVTLSDLTEALMGDAALFGKRRQYRPVRRPDGSWLLDGLAPIDSVTECLGITRRPPGSEGRYQSLGGLVFTLMGKVPEVGDAVEWDDWRFEVVDMDGMRIDKVLATQVAQGEAPMSNGLTNRLGGTDR
jgi:putative hemolysin